MMVLIGASGYDHKDWLGRFYPEGIEADDLLAFYAQELDMVELTSTYRTMPTADELARLSKQVPRRFIFSALVHETLLAGELSQAGRFREGLEPLVETGQLACVVASFPQSFRMSQKNKESLAALRDALSDLQLVVEFVHSSWIADGMPDWLRAHGLNYCCVDLPRLPGLTQPICWVTGPVAYARFHGRNKNLRQGDALAGKHHDYRYDPLELAEWLPKVEEMERLASLVLVCLCNTPQARAAESARLLRRMIVVDR